jgi:hypothetical protein
MSIAKTHRTQYFIGKDKNILWEALVRGKGVIVPHMEEIDPQKIANVRMSEEAKDLLT